MNAFLNQKKRKEIRKREGGREGWKAGKHAKCINS